MKKLYFFCIALVALMLASCGGKDYREMLPADSFVIVSINPESLSRKRRSAILPKAFIIRWPSKLWPMRPKRSADASSLCWRILRKRGWMWAATCLCSRRWRMRRRQAILRSAVCSRWVIARSSIVSWAGFRRRAVSPRSKRMESPSLPIRRARICLSSLMTKRPFWSIPLPLTMIRRKLPPRSSSPRRKQRV